MSGSTLCSMKDSQHDEAVPALVDLIDDDVRQPRRDPFQRIANLAGAPEAGKHGHGFHIAQNLIDDFFGNFRPVHRDPGLDILKIAFRFVPEGDVHS